MFTKKGWRQTHYFGAGKLPGDGWCILFVGYGCIIGRKTSIKREQKGDNDQYDLYIFGSNVYEYVNKKLNGNAGTISVEFITNPTIWRYDANRVSLSVKHICIEWQTNLIDQIIDLYTHKKRLSVCIQGPPGVGKSEIGFLLNREICKRTQKNCQPLTVIADPTKRGMPMSGLIGGRCKEVPIILVFNEFNVAVQHAESLTKENKSEGMCIAETRTSLLDTLDHLSNTRYVILITTANEEIPFVYRRPGRMDLVVDVPKEVKPFFN